MRATRRYLFAFPLLLAADPMSTLAAQATAAIPAVGTPATQPAP